MSSGFVPVSHAHKLLANNTCPSRGVSGMSHILSAVPGAFFVLFYLFICMQKNTVTIIMYNKIHINIILMKIAKEYKKYLCVY